MEKNPNVTKLKEIVLGKIAGLNHTYRFSGSVKTKDQSVAEHSFWTALIAGALAKYENEKRKENGKYVSPLNTAKLYEQALFHDIEEVVTGDINHLFKHRSEGKEFRKLLNELTIASVKEEIFDIILCGDIYMEDWKESHEDTEENYLIKMGDWLQLLQYVDEEYRRGNNYFIPVIKRVVKLITDKNNSELLRYRFFYTPFLIKDFLEEYVEESKLY